MDGKPYTSNQATIWRWRKHYQHDFAARMDWCVAAKFNQVNHNPVAILNGDRSKQIVKITTKSRDNIKLTAVGSSDPDDNKISSSWMIYREASTSSNGVKLTQLHSHPQPCKLFSAPCHPAKPGVEEPKRGLKKRPPGCFPGHKNCARPSDSFTQNPGSANCNFIVHNYNCQVTGTVLA